MFITLNVNNKENQCIDYEDLQAAHETRTPGNHLPWKALCAARDHVYLRSAPVVSSSLAS